MSEQKYNEGDLVEVVHEDSSRATSKLVNYGDSGLYLEKFPNIPFIKMMPRDGWSVARIVERAPVKPPTEPGFYLSDPETRTGGLLQLTEKGEWWWVGNKYQPRPERILTDKGVAAHAPLTRLEPVSK